MAFSIRPLTTILICLSLAVALEPVVAGVQVCQCQPADAWRKSSLTTADVNHPARETEIEVLFATLNPSDTDELPAYYLRTPVHPGLVTPEECERIVAEAEVDAALNSGWETKRHKNYPTVDLDTRKIPSIRPLVWDITTTRIFPRLEEEFGLPRGCLILNEAFVVKYTVSGQRMLEAHRDYSEFSFVVALNEGYGGGGTHFVHINQTVKPSMGSAVLFAGRHLHQGMEVIDGARYILAGFLFLATHDRKTEAMFSACDQGDLPMVQWLVEGIDPTLVHAQLDGSLATPLMEAAYEGHLSIVDYLLARGAMVNQQYQGGFTALYLACQEGRLAVVDLLLQHGANHLLGLHRASRKTTPLQIACHRGHLAVVQRLLEHDPSSVHVNRLDVHNRRPLWNACMRGHMDIALVLMQHGADFGRDTIDDDMAATVALHERKRLNYLPVDDVRLVVCEGLYDEDSGVE